MTGKCPGRDNYLDLICSVEPTYFSAFTLRDLMILILNLTYIDLVYKAEFCTPKMKFRGKAVQS